MRILMICALAPTRERPRAHGFALALARSGYSVTLVFVDRAGTTFDGLTDSCERIVPVRRISRLSAATWGELAAFPFDLVHLDGPAAHLVRGPLPIPTVVDAGMCCAMRRERSARAGGALLRAARVAQAARARRCMRAAVAHSARLLVATPDDAWAFHTLEPLPAGVHVVPSLVDLEHFAPPLTLREQAEVALDLRGLDWGEAVAAMAMAHATMELVWARRPEVQLNVIGRAPLGTAGYLNHEKRVRFAGVTGDPRTSLVRATLALVPLASSGAPAHAPLEAMATAAPLVTNPEIARDLGAMSGHEMLTATEPAGWSEAILALLDDPPYRGRIGRAGRRLVELRHGPRVVGAAIENVYAAAIGSCLAAWRLEVGLDSIREAS